METKELRVILNLLDEEISEAEFAVDHCKRNGYGELHGQQERLMSARRARAAILSANGKVDDE